jgi:hypothetical protein
VRRLPVIAAAALVAALLAGCGGGSTDTSKTIYSRAKTMACLKDAGARIGGDLDFVASTATGGAFRAHLPDNFVTVVFGRTIEDADNIDQAYVHFHAQNVGIADVLRQQGNAVMLWHAHPVDDDLGTVTDCLKKA